MFFYRKKSQIWNNLLTIRSLDFTAQTPIELSWTLFFFFLNDKITQQLQCEYGDVFRSATIFILMHSTSMLTHLWNVRGTLMLSALHGIYDAMDVCPLRSCILTLFRFICFMFCSCYCWCCCWYGLVSFIKTMLHYIRTSCAANYLHCDTLE